MATVIDSLVVELGLDPTKFVMGTVKGKAALVELKDNVVKFKNTAEPSFKSVAVGAKKMEDAFAGVGTKLLGLAALFTGGIGIAAFMSQLIKATAEIGRLSAGLGTSAQDLWAWDAAGRQFGVRAGSMQVAWKAMSNAINDQAMGVGPIANRRFFEFWRERGVAFTDVQGKAASMTKTLEALNRAAFAIKDKREAATFLRGLPGIGGNDELINMLMTTPPKDFSAAYAKNFGLAPDPAAVKAAAEAMREYEETWAKTSSLASGMIPIITVGLGLVNAFATGLERITAQIESWWNTSDFVKYLKDKALQSGGDMGTPGVGWVPGMPTPSGNVLDRIGPQGGGSAGGGRGRAGSATGAVGTGGAAPSGGAAASTGGGTLPGGADVGSSLQGGGGPPGPRSENAQRMYNEARRLGYDHEHASAMMGHVQAESGFNPNATGDAGTAHGFFQHRGERWRSAQRQAAAEGLDPRSPEAAVRHFHNELQTTERRAGRAFMAAENTRDAVTALNGYERFMGWQRGQAARYNAASRFERTMSPTGAAVSPGGAPPVGATSAWGNSARAVPWLTNPGSLGLMPGGQASNTTNNSSSAETHVGSVTVQTQASDAYGIASDMRSAIERVGNVGVNNNGPN